MKKALEHLVNYNKNISYIDISIVDNEIDLTNGYKIIRENYFIYATSILHKYIHEYIYKLNDVKIVSYIGNVGEKIIVPDIIDRLIITILQSDSIIYDKDRFNIYRQLYCGLDNFLNKDINYGKYEVYFPNDNSKKIIKLFKDGYIYITNISYQQRVTLISIYLCINGVFLETTIEYYNKSVALLDNLCNIKELLFTAIKSLLTYGENDDILLNVGYISENQLLSDALKGL